MRAGNPTRLQSRTNCRRDGNWSQYLARPPTGTTDAFFENIRHGVVVRECTVLLDGAANGSGIVRALRFIAAILLIAGCALTCRAGYMHAKAKLAGALIRRAWEQSLQSVKAETPWPSADFRPIARLQIPRLGYDEIVLEGATPRTLAFGRPHMLSGAGFGEPGNLLLAGHRTSWFLPLERIMQYDAIQISWFDSRR